MQRLTGADKTARREAKSNQKKEAAVGAQLMREITDPHNQTFAIISDPTWRPSSPHLQPTWAAQPERKCGGHGGGDDNSTASAAAEDPKRALVHALQADLSRMSVLLERLDELLSA